MTLDVTRAISQADKRKHFAVGVAVGLGVTAFLSTKDVGLDVVSGALISIPTVTIVAFGKEAFDEIGNMLGWFDHKHGVELMDAIATIFGGIVGAILAISLIG